ncbi:hypothetical protein LEMA_P108000.1 [Plenodomus lingam JN3]|uniref:Uncharacterized protein n=2 Tax=Leptosphaeria maculans TaxID=5022 RepID=E4ZYK9_LEPMJ|nr:hypothetical protein LEMA_P108000.1 [Plenodomus lingam JN3]CBX96535.1 hypothetical protein LEMA_P108000.1 [Plenodomus lingam JN3]
MTSQQHSPDDLTHPLDVARRALYVGPFTGVFGLTSGAVYGTLRTETPVLFSLISGVQCFTLGTTFWGLRTAILNSDGLQNWWYATRGSPLKVRCDLEPTMNEKLQASTMAGALTGFSLGFVFRIPANVIPGTIFWGLFGYLGQRGYNYFDARNTAAIERKARGEEEPGESLMYRFAKSKWSPMSVLNDEEYEKMMQEKVLHVEAEIALIDDKIAELRKKAAESRDQGTQKASPAPTKPGQ